MSRSVEVLWKIGDERGVPLESLKTRKYVFEVPRHWDEESGWTDKDVIRSATMELAKDAYNTLGILNTEVISAKLIEREGGAE